MAIRPVISSVRRGASLVKPALVAGALVALACGGGDDPGDQAVAEVGDRSITVRETAEFMKRTGRGLTEDAVRRSVDNLVDLALVEMRAKDAVTFGARESLQMKEWREILTINQFREDVVWKDVEVDDQKLRDWYEENVGEERRARHILIGVDASASEDEKAKARATADSLHEAIANGADMAELARERSDDTGSAQRGGMLDWFGRGQMVEPFENAAFSTPVGELAPVVETQFGYHVLRVEDSRKRPFEDLREEIEQQVMGPQRSEAEQAYIQNLMETSGIEFFEANVDRFIRIVQSEAPQEPDADTRDLPLVTYDGGRITLGELWTLYRALPPGNQRAIARLDQAGMIQALSTLVQQRLLLEKAKTADVALDSTRQSQLDDRIDQLYMETYLRDAARARLEVPDSLVRSYYDEHREFYSGQDFEDVEEQIRTVLQTQRMQSMQEADAQTKLVEAVADSMAAEVEVTVHEDRFDDVLDVLRGMYEEEGSEPPVETPEAGTPTGTPATVPGPAPAGGGTAPPPAAAPGTETDGSTP